MDTQNNDILYELVRSEKKFDNNQSKIAKLENTNDSLTSEICWTIHNSKNAILQQIEDNREYLNLHPGFSNTVDDINEWISQDQIDNISRAKTVIRILTEIDSHNQNIDAHQDNNFFTLKPSKVIDKMAKALLKEELDNVN